MTAQRVIALANRFRIKLALDRDMPTNPGLDIISPPAKEPPKMEEPPKVVSPEIYEQPTHITNVEPIKHTPSSTDDMSRPGVGGIIVDPVEREFFDRFAHHLVRAKNAFESDYATLRYSGALSNPKVKNIAINLHKIYSNIQGFIFSSKSTRHPLAVAKDFIMYVAENKTSIIKTYNDLYHYLVEEEGRMDPISIPALIETYKTIYFDKDFAGELISSAPKPEVLGAFIHKHPLYKKRSMQRIRNLILGISNSLGGQILV